VELSGEKAFFDALNRADVAHLVVSGLAVNAHGYVRMKMGIDRVTSDPPVDPATTMTRFWKALEEAEAFVLRMPTDKIGLLFLKGGKVV
jgi:hypothetical protein